MQPDKITKTGAKAMTQTESQSELAAIENAEVIIERFGGIRPMASKINVPVTTIQGWKKRNVIPGTRRADILSAANQLGVDLSDIMASAPAAAPSSAPSSSPSSVANENGRQNNQDNLRAERKPASSSAPSFDSYVEQQGPQNFVPHNPAASSYSAKSATDISAHLAEKLAQTERRAITKSTIVNLFILALVVGSITLLVWPQNEQRFFAIENNVSELQQKQNFLSRLIPSDIESKISALQNQADQLQSGLSDALSQAKNFSGVVMAPDVGNLEERVIRLENHITEMTGLPTSQHLSDLMNRFQSWSENVGGQAKLSSAVSQLSTMLAGVPTEDPALVEQALQSAPQQNPELAETFAGVPPQDIKAAALLLGMTQFRSSLNRDNQPFADDLALLKKLVGAEDAELSASIDRLAPYAARGVLTPAGLSNEFRGVAGDVVVASLQGEDVSIKDKARARLGEMFQIEKNGEPIGGTPAQNTLAKTDQLLQQGNLEGAIAQMQMLDGNALAAAQPWLTKANATLVAQKLKTTLTQSIGKKSIYNTSGPLPNAARGLNIPRSSELIEQPQNPAIETIPLVPSAPAESSVQSNEIESTAPLSTAPAPATPESQPSFQ